LENRSMCSRTRSVSGTFAVCNIAPVRTRVRGSRGSPPKTRTWPDVGLRRPRSNLTAVVVAALKRTSSATSSPGWIEKSMCSSARTVPKSFVTACSAAMVGRVPAWLGCGICTTSESMPCLLAMTRPSSLRAQRPRSADHQPPRMTIVMVVEGKCPGVGLGSWFDGAASFLPGLESAANVSHVVQSHILCRCRRQRGATSAGTVEKKSLAGGKDRVVIGQRGIQNKLQHAAIDMHGAGDLAVARQFGRVTQVDKDRVGIFDRVHGFLDRNGSDLAICLGNQFFGALHGVLQN